MIEQLKQGLINDGKNPDDYNIVIKEGVIMVSPKHSYEIRQTAKQEDAPIKEDVNTVAETAAITMEDAAVLADTVVYLMNKVSELEAIING